MIDRGKLHDYAPGDGVTAGAHAPDFDDAAWLDVAIPGDVHRTLIAAGRIPDPFFDQNETACAWMEEREWWYRIQLVAPTEPLAGDERLRLAFHGLDTFVTVYLDGNELGAHGNMFRAAEFDVTDRLVPGQTHALALCFHPPLKAIAGMPQGDWGANGTERTAMRKAQFGYGWDWGPRLPTIGIWRPVELRRVKGAALIGTQLSTVDLARDHGLVLVAVRVEAERVAGHAPISAEVVLAEPGGDRSWTATLTGEPDAAGALDLTAYLTVPQPRLWWTHDFGEPFLYDLTVTLRSAGETVDRLETKVGIRTLALDQSPDAAERGTRFFRFVLNGVPIFAKGADWIPCDSFVGAIPPERYTDRLTQARDANMTMLRVWGGGIYEHDVFYDECDRLGILVWQDFMFACAAFPEWDPTLAEEVDLEARYQVRRLRGHPSLALWCGNNENQWLHDGRHWDNPDPPPYGELFYNHILPRAVAELDGRTPYWPGSPFGGNDHNSMVEGNRHNWDAWHGQHPRRFGERPEREFTPESVSYRRYAEDLGRFISEFGLHAPPGVETLRRVIPEAELFHHSPSMDWHNKDNPKNKGDMLMQSVTGVPQDLDEYIDFSQIAQAEGLKFGIEHYRRRTPHCSGTLVWQLDDCWPVQSWSVLDYYGVGKAGYFYLKRVYSPVLASFKETDEGVELWVTNDTRGPLQEEIAVTLGTFGGETIETWSLYVEVPPTSSQPVFRWGQEIAAPDRYLRVVATSGRFPANRHFFAAIKDVRRRPVEPSVRIEPVSDHELHVTVGAPEDGYAYFVHLTTPDEHTRYSDNFLDLAPGEQREITVTNQVASLASADVAVRWR